MLTTLGAVSVTQDFSGDPRASGWRAFGSTNLFSWDSTNQNLRVTWDSSQTNSFFCRPLETILGKDDDFGFAFDLRLDDIAAGVDPNKPSTFQIAIALLKLDDALRTNFLRGTGINSAQGARNAVEFDYFPDSSSGFGATISPILVSSNNQFAYSDTFPVELTVNDLFRVELSYTASNQTLVTVITRNGEPFVTINSTTIPGAFTDFRLDTVAVCSFNDAGQEPPQFAGSIRAHGTMDNIVVTLPPPPVMNFAGVFTNGFWQAQFTGRSNWLYTLERTMDFRSWMSASPATLGNAANLFLQDTNPIGDKSFYRVKAERP